MTLLPTLLGETYSTPPAQHGFGNKASKLAALFGHDASALILLIGSLPAGWDADFRSHFQRPVVVRSELDLQAALERGRKYDLILCAWPPFSARSTIRELLTRLRGALAPRGSLFAFVDNRVGLRKLIRDPSRIFARGGSTIVGFRHQLRRAGFQRIRQFLPLPDASNMEEFVRPEGGPVALPSYASAIAVLLNRFGLLPIIHDGGAYIASGDGAGPERFLRELVRCMTASGQAIQELDIERFDLRNRGALVAVLRAPNCGRRFLCRLTTDAAADLIVRRNTEWTDRLTSTATLSREVKAAIPTSVGVFALPGGTAYVEAHIPGTIAWKLAGSRRLEPTIYSELYGFITAFNRNTARALRIGDGLLMQLLDPFVPHNVDARVAGAYQTLRDLLRGRLLGGERVIVWAHGDFGYGNAIVDPRTGALTGVIDWDQAREDLAGVDFVHFLVQRERGRREYSLLAALDEVARSVTRDGLHGGDERMDYEKEFALVAESRSELLALVALRFAQRSMVYSSLFGTTAENTRKILEWGTTILR